MFIQQIKNIELMTNFIDKASLIMIPSAYGEGKLACQKPTDGSGDFTFTRASSALRTNPSGFLEPACYNLLSYSETYSTGWFNQNTVISSNVITAPNNTMSASKLSANNTLNQHRIYSQATLNNEGILSVYAKGGEYNFLSLGASGGVNGGNIIFNLSNGTITGSQSGFTPIIENVGNSWYRCSLQSTTLGPGTSLSYFIIVRNSATTSDYVGNNVDGIYIWGAQLTQGSTIKPYQKTTDRLNVPRLDYSNGATCPSVLIEPQRTNLLTYSNDFSNAIWTKAFTTITPNFAISPDGTLNASKMDCSSINSGLTHSLGSQPAGTYTFSGYIKATGSNIGKEIAIRFQTSPFTQTNLVTNGEWQKIEVTITTSSNVVLYPKFLVFGLTNPVSEILIYGAQLEAGSYATSYIPTTTTAVTRIADVCSKSGISSLIGQTEGTVYLEINVNKSMIGRPFTNIITLQDAIFNFLNIYIDSSTSSIRVRVRKDNGSIVNIMIKNISIGTLKIAVKYINGNYKLFLNGILESTSTDSTNFPTPPLNTLVLSDVNFGSNSYPTKNIMLFKTQLTDQECIELTTP